MNGSEFTLRSLPALQRVTLQRLVRARRLRTAAGALTAALLLAACSTAAPVTALEDGSLRVGCPGGYHDWSRCEAAARAQCGAGGYQELGRISDEGGNVGTRDWSQAGSDVSRSMTFRCVR
ncbi:MAG TPA: hypothetical protein DCR65_05700 [Gammaproteobacteria bacterium]|nr:hypothetical protein [Gammaproteobacteria bacterium]